MPREHYQLSCGDTDSIYYCLSKPTLQEAAQPELLQEFRSELYDHFFYFFIFFFNIFISPKTQQCNITVYKKCTILIGQLERHLYIYKIRRKELFFPEVPRLAQRAIQFSFRWQFAPALSRPGETPRWSTGSRQWQAARGPMDCAAWSVTLQ